MALNLQLILGIWQERAEEAERRAKVLGRWTFEGKAEASAAAAIRRCVSDLHRALGDPDGS